MNFRKYNSIENTYQQKVIEQIYFHEFDKATFVVQEKVHGANFSLITDGENIEAAKRTSLLAPDEQFYNFQYVRDLYAENLLALFQDLKAEFPATKQIAVFGELFGGSYAHADVPINKTMTKVQKGIDYCPENDFYAFDIILNAEQYLDADTCNALFEKYGFFYAKTLFEGDLQTALDYSCVFESLIPAWKGLPAIENNICEGIIIRPKQPLFFGNGSRVILKKKNEKWVEKTRKTRAPKGKVELSEAAQNLWDELNSFITLNRLNNVLSKEGAFEPQLMGKIIAATTQDVRQDFFKEHEHAFYALDKPEQKRLNKLMNSAIVQLIKTELMGIPI